MAYTNPTTGIVHGCGLLMPKDGRKKLVSAGEVMPLYTEAQLVKRCQDAGGEIGLVDFPLLATNQANTEECWRWSAGQIMEALEWSLTGVAKRLDISIPDNDCRDGNDIHASWTDGIEPYGICTAEYMGTDPARKTDNPPMIYGVSRFPDGWKAEAIKRKGVERYECEDWLAMCSAIANGHPCGLGVNCPGGGHAVTAWVLGVDANGQLYTRGNGSWGDDYASGWASNPKYPGTYTLTKRMASAAFGGFGCQAYVGARDDEDAPPAAK